MGGAGQVHGRGMYEGQNLMPSNTVMRSSEFRMGGVLAPDDEAREELSADDEARDELSAGGKARRETSMDDEARGELSTGSEARRELATDEKAASLAVRFLA